MPENERVRAPPGGHTTFTLGGGEIESITVSANRYARGHDQNSGNVMTGYPTTRVHAPPGGKSSICFDDGSSSAIKSSPTEARTRPGKYSAPSKPPLPGEAVSRGQMPTGGIQHHKFGTPSPMPHEIREQPTFKNSYRFSDVPEPQRIDYDAPPVGGPSALHLGSAKPSPVVRPAEPPSWPHGSPYAAGLEANKEECRQGQATMGLDNSPLRENERLPPGGLQHNIFNRASLDTDPRMFPRDEEARDQERLPPGGLQHNIFNRQSIAADTRRMFPAEEVATTLSGRMPPGGTSNIIFGGDRDSIPAITRPGAGASAPRALEEKFQRMHKRAPPGGTSTIQLG
ncbi:unnamed protein product [Amoebophrya sp. A25]|nr:unnamed protein product [Amoebophrya sp. A25]|eukprot:GSA25T00024283001.1